MTGVPLSARIGAKGRTPAEIAARAAVVTLRGRFCTAVKLIDLALRDGTPDALRDLAARLRELLPDAF